MRQRLGIAQTIMEEPSLLILDEPMNGLDNQGVQEMRQLFLKLKEEGKTILLASHNRRWRLTEERLRKRGREQWQTDTQQKNCWKANAFPER